MHSDCQRSAGRQGRPRQHHDFAALTVVGMAGPGLVALLVGVALVYAWSVPWQVGNSARLACHGSGKEMGKAEP
jgi:hypothetical protein